MNQRTKIVCTIGPASQSLSMLKRMMRAGMGVARLNFSHATHKDHRRLIRSIRLAAVETKRFVPIIGDLQGPKIRLGNLPEKGIVLKTGETVVFSTRVNEYTENSLPVTYEKLHKDLKKGDRILIDDGILDLVVERISGQNIQAKVKTGGVVTSHKGMNFPDSTLSISSFTTKDREDALFAIKQGVEWLALSFVTKPETVFTLKRLIKKHTPKNQVPARVIVKIEKHEAITRFHEILAAADAIMIARGDLGVEIEAEEVPVKQKEIIEACRWVGKPVIVATQMLDSMIRNPRPTRAEVSDVANAVFDHTDAVMLSGEAATGKYPLKAVQTMANIIQEAEKSVFDNVALLPLHKNDQPEDVSAYSIKRLSIQGAIHGVLASHTLAPWSERIHKVRPEAPLFLAVGSEREARQMSLFWGVIPFVIKTQKEETFVRVALRKLKASRTIKKGSKLAVVIGQQHGEGFDVIPVT